MRKKLAAFVVVAGVVFVGYNVMHSQSDKNAMSDLLMANVEALANDESGGNSVTCYSSSRSSSGSQKGSPGTFWTVSFFKLIIYETHFIFLFKFSFILLSA